MDFQTLILDIDFLAGSDSNTYPTIDKTRNMNGRYSTAVSLILESDGRWQWDDSNWTDLPIGRANLVSGQQDYSMFIAPPDTGEDYLRVTQVLVRDNNGGTIQIAPIDQSDFSGTALKALGLAGGVPQIYDKLGPSFFLYPIPNYNYTQGLIVYFQRAPFYFTVNDTIKRPGFASIFHRYISLGAAFDFAVAKRLPQAQSLQNDLLKMEQEMKSFYAKRNKDEQIRLVNGQNRTSCGVSRFR